MRYAISLAAITMLGNLATSANLKGQTPQYQIYQLGLSGTAYSSQASDAPQSFAAFNSSGQAAGYTNRVGPAQGFYVPSYGSDAWYFDGATTREIGYYGPGYSFTDPTSGEVYENSNARFIDDGGDIAGYSERFSPISTISNKVSLGSDIWFFNGNTTQNIGLIGPGYSYDDAAAGGQVYEASSIRRMNSSGQVLGWSYRYDSSGNSLGVDSWIYAAGNTQVIGLSGSEYNYTPSSGGKYQYNFPIGFNDAGHASGDTLRFDSSGNSLGRDDWFFNGSATQKIGLTGPDYSYTTASGGTYQSAFAPILIGGTVAGSSNRYNASGAQVGQDAWVFNGTTTIQAGLTGPDYSYVDTNAGGGTYRFSYISRINKNGQLAGISQRYDPSGNSLGSDCWVFNGSTTQQIGLVGGIYSQQYNQSGIAQSSGPELINDSGQVAGNSTRGFAPNAVTSLGNDTWFFNGKTTQQIGLVGAGYTYTDANGVHQNSTLEDMNNAGQVVGFSTPYPNSYYVTTEVPWLFDPITNVTSPLNFDGGSGTVQFDSSDYLALTDSGDVYGTYELYDGSTDEGTRPFFWSPSKGFFDVDSLVAGGLTAHGWQYLETDSPLGTSINGFPQYFTGTGLPTGYSSLLSSGPYAHVPYLMVQDVPEPAALSIVAFASFFLIRRRTLASTRYAR